MDRQEAKQEIRQNWRSLITDITDPAKQRVNGEASYICPCCGHGQHGDGLTVNPGSKDGCGLKCFGCGFSGDILDLYQRAQGLDFNGALSLLSDKLGITIDGPQEGHNRPQERREAAGGYTNTPAAGKAIQGQLGGNNETADYTQYYLECFARIHDPAAVAYLQGRGISPETAEKNSIGFDPAADPVNAPGGIGQKKFPAPRIIVPSTPAHYMGRAIDPGNGYPKINVKGVKVGIYNQYLLYYPGAETCFITEGVFDALSILEAGAAALALNSADNADLLLKQLEEKRTEKTLILCLDNDGAGKKATEKLRAGLTRLNIPFVVVDICGSFKDANDRLIADRPGLEAAIQEAQRQTAAKPDNIALYIDCFMSADINAFKDDIKTGFANLDKASGGLYSGLYILAAISSLGKTSFCLQLADQIAAAGQDVLYFSLEQSKLELVSKSIARITAQYSRAQETAGQRAENPVTALAIRRGFLPPIVLEAAQEYKETCGETMNIIEGNFNCDIAFIGDYIRRYIDRNNVKPVVILDYLQILQPLEAAPGGRVQSTKETVDLTTTELKRISRSLGLTIIAICSVNRANYLTPIDFESLKESGNIEFTADCIWGLQLHEIGTQEFDKIGSITEKRKKVKEAKAATPRQIDLVCLKNRFGISSYSCSFDYYPANDLFVEAADFAEYETPKKAGRKIGG